MKTVDGEIVISVKELHAKVKKFQSGDLPPEEFFDWLFKHPVTHGKTGEDRSVPGTSFPAGTIRV